MTSDSFNSEDGHQSPIENIKTVVSGKTADSDDTNDSSTEVKKVDEGVSETEERTSDSEEELEQSKPKSGDISQTGNDSSDLNSTKGEPESGVVDELMSDISDIDQSN